ncbi:glutamate--tRNA ligase [Longivirga aurantiaca]|uniref:Glutamate--tRNA ligase n=1 Tax=Longivirga aurantiaca TaxID=1837743 RepID=A0ABW1T0J2_9ACTN
MTAIPSLPATGSSPIRVRFCPSPTGNPHVGMVRTALFNWAYARHTGGTFVFRIEDTDSARDSEQSYEDLLGALRWLGMDWDEGPVVGGPHAPYRQSQRMDIYADVAAKLVEAGLAYESFSTPDEVEERRRAAGQDPKLGYDNKDRDLTDEQKAAFRAEGRLPVLRMRMPDQDWTWDDLVRGDVTFGREHVPDFVIVRGNGEPLYTLVNPVDDALMGITHVLRGEDLLSSTPRQLAMYAALAQIGVGDGSTPRFGHLPYVMGEGNKKLSKRDPQSSLNLYREEGYLPEGLLNYLALLGWSAGDDLEFFSPTQLAELFDLGRVQPNPARFDPKKCLAINGDWIRHISADDLASRLVPYLVAVGALDGDPTPEQKAVIDAAVPLVQERMETLRSGAEQLRFLLVDEADFVVDAEDRERVLTEDARPTVQAAYDALAGLAGFDHASVEAALREALVEGLGLKPKLAFGPVRVAVTGRRISPPLFESIELLGRDRTLARLQAALA